MSHKVNVLIFGAPLELIDVQITNDCFKFLILWNDLFNKGLIHFNSNDRILLALIEEKFKVVSLLF